MPSDNEYPQVFRVSDPLVIRPCRLSLQINETIYYAKIKFGINYCGFYVYANPTGYPIYECKDEELTKEWANGSSSIVPSMTEIQVREELEQQAQKWIDDLQEAVLEHRPDNELKKAIDRLTWQLHYDITESDADFTQMFSDFSDIDIDRPTNTIYQTITSSATTLGNAVGDGADVIIGSSTSGAGIWSISNSIESFNTALTGSSGALNTYIGKVIYDSQSTSTVCGYINKVATNLRADDNGNYQEYTISRALREYVPGASSQEKSVSGATKEQTDLEQQSFNEISVNQLGAFGEGDSGAAGHRTLYATLGAYTQSNKDDLSQAVGLTTDTASALSLTGKLLDTKADILAELDDSVSGTVGDRVKSIYDSIGDNNSGIVSNINSVLEKIGSATTSDTLWYDVIHNAGAADVTMTMGSGSTAYRIKDMRDAMFGNGSQNGFAVQGTNNFYVRTSD
jgi:hypothetical protein